MVPRCINETTVQDDRTSTSDMQTTEVHTGGLAMQAICGTPIVLLECYERNQPSGLPDIAIHLRQYYLPKTPPSTAYTHALPTTP